MALLSKYAQNHLTSSRHLLCACFKPLSSHPCIMSVGFSLIFPAPHLPFTPPATAALSSALGRAASCKDCQILPLWCGNPPHVAHLAWGKAWCLQSTQTLHKLDCSTHFPSLTLFHPHRLLCCFQTRPATLLPGPWCWPVPLPGMPFVQHLSQFPLLPFAQMFPSR